MRKNRKSNSEKTKNIRDYEDLIDKLDIEYEMNRENQEEIVKYKTLVIGENEQEYR
jgi:hypothetical protein